MKQSNRKIAMIKRLGLSIAFATLAAMPAAAQTGGAPGGITMKITASCLPMPDLSVSDCVLIDGDPDSAPASMKDDPIIKGGIEQISKLHLPTNWQTIFKMDGKRVIISMRIVLRKIG
jgi:hypothetical protein